MDPVENELNQIATALRRPETLPEQYVQLYAAQQALVWCRQPELFAPPFKTIVQGKVNPLPTRTLEDSADYLARGHHAQS